jgi:hypothetical protein
MDRGAAPSAVTVLGGVAGLIIRGSPGLTRECSLR